MRTVNVITLGGASNSSAGTKIEDLVRSIAHEERVRIDADHIDHTILNRRTARAISEAVADCDYGAPLLVVGKSQGAWRFADWARKNPVFFNRPNTRVVTIDPHHWLLGDKPIRVGNRLCPWTNFMQKEDYPKGAQIFKAHNVLLEGCGHWNIVENHVVREHIAYCLENLAC